MNYKLGALVAGALLSINLSALAAGDDVFGMQLGARLSVGECAMTGKHYSIGTDRPCFEKLSSTQVRGTEVWEGTVLIRFPAHSSPAVASGGTVAATVMEGNLQGIGFNTRGVANADEVLSVLRAKYGNPSAMKTRTAQNGRGERHEVFDAAWTAGNVVVTFQSATRSFSTGLVNIQTRKGYEDQQRQLREITRDKRPL